MSDDTTSEDVDYSDELQRLVETAFGGAAEALKDGVMPAYAFYCEGDETSMTEPPGANPREMLEAMKLWLRDYPGVSRLVLVFAGEDATPKEACLWAMCFERGHTKGWLLGQQIQKGIFSKTFKPVGEIFFEEDCEPIFE